MAIIIETGAGLENSNSLIDATELEAILTESGEFTSLSALTTTQLEQLLVKSMQYLNNNYQVVISGEITNELQALLFPRKYCYYRGYLLADDAIHTKWKLAQAKLCLYQYDVDTTTQIATNIKESKVKVGPIEEEFVYKDGQDGKPTPSLLMDVNVILKAFFNARDNWVFPMRQNYGNV